VVAGVDAVKLVAVEDPTSAAAFRERFDSDLHPVFGMPALLDELSLRRCVASSAAPERIRHSLDLTNLSRHFPAVFSATQVRHGKPAPDLFLLAATSFDTAPDRCVVVEDSTAGVAAGMYVIGFTAAGHCRPDHGLGLESAGAAVIANTVGELSELLNSLSG
jgi:HAD superfamily hydrolase (TIGR01509 family)